MKKYALILLSSYLLLSCSLLRKKEMVGSVTSLTWMDQTFTYKIEKSQMADTVGLLVETKNFKTGKTIDINIKYYDDDNPSEEGTDTIIKIIRGTIEADGYARIIVDLSKTASYEE